MQHTCLRARMHLGRTWAPVDLLTPTLPVKFTGTQQYSTTNYTQRLHPKTTPKDSTTQLHPKIGRAHVPLSSCRRDKQQGCGVMMRGRGVTDSDSAGECALLFSITSEPCSFTCERG
jgi:hypothetical protein